MKRNTIIFIALFLMLMQGTLFANKWNKPDKGYFKAQKDIEKTIAGFNTFSMATINFEGMLFNFVHFKLTSFAYGKIIHRKLKNSGGYNLNFNSDSDDKKDNIEHLKGLAPWTWQPAPVIFNDVLYLFVVSKEGFKKPGYISYSAYNPSGDEWSKLRSTKLNIGSEEDKDYYTGMSASVVDGKLCIVYRNSDKKIHILWTEDLETWNDYSTDIHSGVGDLREHAISAIPVSCWINGKKTTKLMFAYLNNRHVYSAEYYFNESNELKQLSKSTITDQDVYSSVALAEGTVNDDPTSTGRCVQAFLKRDNLDNVYRRYRIKRFQLKDGKWSKRENNLVKQNYLWASHGVNLSVANFAIPTTDGSKDVRQFMCLVYRGYDDFDTPLNAAWAETDRLVFSGNENIELGGPENTQYIGYIEGPPPFHINNKNGLDNPYEKNYERISEIEYSNSQSTSTSKDLKFDVGGYAKIKASWFRMDLNAAYTRATNVDSTLTVTATISIEAQEEAYGYYIKLTPVITNASYWVYDWKYDKNNPMNSTPIDTTYYCYLSEPKVVYENVDLQSGLVPGDLSTYMNRPIDFSRYTSYNAYHIDQASNAWVPGSKTSQKIAVETNSSASNGFKGELKIGGASPHEAFEGGFQGSVEYSMTTTTGQGNEITCWARLNDPKDSTDVKLMMYDIYWLKPNPTQNNWWLHEGAEDQNTWCLTYAVTEFETVGGDSYATNVIDGENDDTNTLLSNVAALSLVNTKTGVKLNWQTIAEKDNYGFEIERSSFQSTTSGESAVWETIGFVKGSENSTSVNEYSFTDSNPLVGKSIYRLKQINTEMNFVYSSNVEIEVEALIATEFELSQNYPNPFNPTTNISFTVPENGQAVLRIFNTLGQEVALLFNGEAQAGTKNQVAFNAANLSSGTYFSRLEYDGKILLKKMLLIK